MSAQLIIIINIIIIIVIIIIIIICHLQQHDRFDSPRPENKHHQQGEGGQEPKHIFIKALEAVDLCI